MRRACWGWRWVGFLVAVLTCAGPWEPQPTTPMVFTPSKASFRRPNLSLPPLKMLSSQPARLTFSTSKTSLVKVPAPSATAIVATVPVVMDLSALVLCPEEGKLAPTLATRWCGVPSQTRHGLRRSGLAHFHHRGGLHPLKTYRLARLVASSSPVVYAGSGPQGNARLASLPRALD